MREGKLSVISGPMFAGKTEALLARIEEAEQKGRIVEVYKPTLDTRHTEAEIVSHSGHRCKAHWIDPDAFPLPTGVDIVAIDEAQFLSSVGVASVLNIVTIGVHVILAGLDLTWKGEPFGVFPTFLSLADEVTKLRSHCKKCGKSACRSYRLVESKETVLVGGNEAYEPRCLRCFGQDR
jgi:thymidine kinase